jgi:hypothetical protein
MSLPGSPHDGIELRLREVLALHLVKEEPL